MSFFLISGTLFTVKHACNDFFENRDRAMWFYIQMLYKKQYENGHDSQKLAQNHWIYLRPLTYCHCKLFFYSQHQEKKEVKKGVKI